MHIPPKQVAPRSFGDRKLQGVNKTAPGSLIVDVPAEQRHGERRTALSAHLHKGGLAVWRFFTSVRIAVILLLVLTGLSLIGTLLIQVPPEVAGDPGEYAWWLENAARLKVGVFTTPLAFLGLFEVFRSPWFLVTGSLLIVSIVVCSLSRWKGISNDLWGSRVKLADGFYEGGANRARFELEMTPQEAAAITHRVLKGKGYRVRHEAASPSLYIAADKNRYFRLGTYLHHLSVVLLVAGYLLTSYLGFREQAFMVPEGSVAEVGYGTNLSLKVETFVDEYWPEGPPKEYRSDVVLYENGVEVQKGVIRVNHPMSYKGIRFYQSFYGPASAMMVRNQEGETLFNDSVALGWVSGTKPYKRPTGTFSVPGTGITAYVIGPAQGYYDPLIQAGQQRVEVYRNGSQVPVAAANLEIGVPKTLAGMEFTFVRERQFSGFQVGRDPTNMLIWIAAAIFVLGLVMVFNFPHRQVWARLHTAQGGKTLVLVRTTSIRSFAVSSDFEGVAEELGRELSLKEKTAVEA